MARIRTIKPELPHSETLGRVSREARLLFVNLFTIADDAGRGRATSRLLASLLYPYDDDAGHLIDGWMSELRGVEAVRLYEANGIAYFDIPKWLEHQKIDRPSASRIPLYSDKFAKPREDARASDALPCTLDLVPTPLKPPKGGGVYTEEFLKFWEAYPHKVGKDAAWKAWKKRKDRPIINAILASVEIYTRTKPAEREWCNPSTWINQGRWNDAPASLVVDNDPVVDQETSRWVVRLAGWNKNKFWMRDQWGPTPSEPFCKAPKGLLTIPLSVREPLGITDAG